jgi:DNA polymerase III alpha subunit
MELLFIKSKLCILSQELANFSKGEADLLRKAMGKKILIYLKIKT